MLQKKCDFRTNVNVNDLAKRRSVSDQKIGKKNDFISDTDKNQNSKLFWQCAKRVKNKQ